MPVAERSGDRILLQTEFREREMVKQVPGVRWDTDAQTWWLPLTWAGCVQLRGVFGDALRVGVDLGAWARAERASRVQPCLTLREAEDCEDLAFLTALRPFQRAGVRFLQVARHALLADEMGLGKTVQAIAALEVAEAAAASDPTQPRAYPALVVCPSSMKRTWAEEFGRWAPGRRVVVVHGSAQTRRKQVAELRDGRADVAVINYESMRQHTRLDSYGSLALSDEEKRPRELNEVAWQSVVADEAHRAKDPKAKQTRALWYLGRSAAYRFALTGTPVANSPEDIWSLMRFVSPDEFPAKTRWVERYALQSWSMFGFMEITGLRAETREELMRIVEPRLVRRLKAAVLPQLPEKTYAVRYVEMEAPQRRAYDQVRKEMLAELKGGVLLATNPLSKLTRMLQFASASGELSGGGAACGHCGGSGMYSETTPCPECDGTGEGQNSVVLRLTEPSCKVDALLEIVEELGDQPAVVFAESRQLIEIAFDQLRRAGYKVGLVTGVVPEGERAEYVRQFQAGRLKLLLLTLGAGGEGLTLTRASTAIFLQRSFSATKNIQAEDRIHRIGQNAQRVVIVDVVTADSIESRVHEVRREKANALEQLVHDEETLKRWLAR